LFEFNGKPTNASWFGGVRPSFSPVVLDLSNTFFSFVFTPILFIHHDSLRFSDSCLHPPRGFRCVGLFWLTECIVGRSFGLSPERLSLTLAAAIFFLVFELFDPSHRSAQACGSVSILVLCEHASQPGPSLHLISVSRPGALVAHHSSSGLHKRVCRMGLVPVHYRSSHHRR
jgi:hypothetical protein